jgi:hypothetical protein
MPQRRFRSSLQKSSSSDRVSSKFAHQAINCQPTKSLYRYPETSQDEGVNARSLVEIRPIDPWCSAITSKTKSNASRNSQQPKGCIRLATPARPLSLACFRLSWLFKSSRFSHDLKSLAVAKPASFNPLEPQNSWNSL